MSEPASNLDPPSPEIGDALEAAGLPRGSNLADILLEFRRMQEAFALASAVDPADLRPLKSLLPAGVPYERARRAADRGDLKSEKPSGRLLSTEPWVARWLAMIGWG